MTFRISLNKASKAAQLGSKAKAEEDAKRREEKNALDKVMADFMEEHGEEKNILGEPDKDHEVDDDVFVPTGSKRHFTGRPRSMKTGPGTLENEAPLGPPFSRPGAPGGFPGQSNRRFGAPVGGTAAQDRASENVYTTVVAKASNLPPAMTPARVEELFAEFPSLKVVKVEKIAPSRPNSPSQRSRPSASMKVTFDKEANARHLDAAMNKLNDKKYLGKGYYLHLDRYLGGRSVSTKQHQEPFGASLQNVEVAKGYAPPPDLGGNNRDRARDDMANKRMIVTANPPPDLPTLRLIHQTVEGVIQGGAEFEAALMEEEKIQTEERFAWLFDQKHPNNRYYRWRLYQMLSSTGDPEVFEGQPEWRGPKEAFPDEFATAPWELKDPDSDPDSEDEDELPAHARSILPAGDDYPGRVATGYGILPPRSRCLLIWLLASVPPSAALYDEVAAISNFAVEHVTKGMDEIVTHLVSNVFTPFYFSKANPKNAAKADAGEEDDGRRRAQIPHLVCNAMKIISDVTLTTQKELGSAYKYRGVIGAQLGDRKVFEYLEGLPTKLDMGKLAKNQFREEINNILKVWTEEHIFEKGILERFDDAFNGRMRQMEQEEAERKAEEKRKAKKGTVPVPKKREVEVKAKDAGAAEAAVVTTQQEESTPMDIDEAPEAPAIEAPSASADAMVVETSKSADPSEIPGETAAARARRLRPKAEDMFASDDED